MKCPRCQSERTHFVTSTISNGPSFSKGCCGALIFGPMGMLCSLCGTGYEISEYWVCDSCGHTFHAGDYENELKNKYDKVEKLKMDVASLEKVVNNNPENLIQEVNEAKTDYEMALKKCNDFEKEFINSSSILQRYDRLFNTVFYGALGVMIAGVVYGIAAFSLVSITVAVFTIVFGLLGIGFMGMLYDKKKQEVDAEKASQLKVLEHDRDAKKKKYDDMKELQNKIDSHEQKVKELSMAEQDLNNYRGEQKND